MRVRIIALALNCILLASCTSLLNGGRDIQLAKAEPLFGKRLDKCLDDPQVLFAMVALGEVKEGITMPIECRDLVGMITKEKSQNASFTPIRFEMESSGYSKLRRNEIVDALVAVSNRKCGDYSAHLKTFDGQSNSALSVISILTGGIGGVVGSEQAARILSGASSIVSGSRAALNESWFSNQTMHVLVSGFEKVRERESREMNNRQACPIEDYSVMDGIGDALKYHSSCSLLTGLSEAAEAIDRADQPGLDTMRRTLADLQAIRKQSRNLVEDDYRRDDLGLSKLELALEKANLAVENTDKEVENLEAEIAAGDSAVPPVSNPGIKAKLAGAKAKSSRLKDSADIARSSYNRFVKEESAKEARFRETSGDIAGTKSSKALCPFT